MAERGVLGLQLIGWLNRLVMWLMPALVGLLVFAASLATPRQSPFGLVTDDDSLGRQGWPATLAVAAIAGLAAAVAGRWRWPLFAVAIVGWLGLSIWAAAMAAAYYAAVKLKRRASSIVFLVGALSLVAAPLVFGAVRQPPEQTTMLVFGLVMASVFVVLPYVVGLWVKARRQVLASLHERAARLEQDQAVRAEQARTEERERIAREMHDVLAHRVSLMVLHAGALEVSGTDERVAAEAEVIRTTGRAALIELRQVLGVLRAGGVAEPAALAPQPLLADVDDLLAQARAAGLAVTRTNEGSPRNLPVTVERAVHRVIQEALTNVAKHAAGAAATVNLRWLPDALELMVRSGPPARPAEPMPAGGFGLVGLRERIELLHGRFETYRRLDGGFVVHALIPTPTQLSPTDSPMDISLTEISSSTGPVSPVEVGPVGPSQADISAAIGEAAR